MQEQLYAAQRQIARLNERVKADAERDKQAADAEAHHQAWRSITEELGLDRPSEVRDIIQNLRQECLSLTESLASSKRENKQLKGTTTMLHLLNLKALACHDDNTIVGPMMNEES